MTATKDFSPAESSAPEQVSMTELAAGGAGEQMAENVPLKGLAKAGWGGLTKQPTFQQLKGARLTEIMLWFIFLLIVIFLVGWWLTRPTVADVQTILGEAASGKEKLEALQSLRSEHFNVFRDLFQLAVASVLVPIFTLLAGYAFGSREAERTREDQQ